jgi:hypothetical protein
MESAYILLTFSQPEPDTGLHGPPYLSPDGGLVEFLFDFLQTSIEGKPMVFIKMGSMELRDTDEGDGAPSIKLDTGCARLIVKFQDMGKEPFHMLRSGNQRFVVSDERDTHQPVPQQPTPDSIKRQACDDPVGVTVPEDKEIAFDMTEASFQDLSPCRKMRYPSKGMIFNKRIPFCHVLSCEPGYSFYSDVAQ